MPKQNDLPSPVTYGQKFYAKAAGMDVDLPEDITPEQKYLKAIAERGESIGNIGDVEIDNPENGEVIKYDAEQGKWINGTASGGGGTSDYTDLTNKPKINGVTLAGNKSLDDIGAADASEVDTLLSGKVDKVTGKGLSTNDFTDAYKTELDGLDTALNGKVDKETGKGLSTEDYTTAEKTKLAAIEAGADVNVQSDWTQTTSTADDYIKNKPTLGTAAAKNYTSSVSSGSDLVTSGAVNTALAAIKDGTNIDSFADVETALGSKVDKETGKGLSTNDFTDSYKTKLDGLDTGIAKTGTFTTAVNQYVYTNQSFTVPALKVAIFTASVFYNASKPNALKVGKNADPEATDEDATLWFHEVGEVSLGALSVSGITQKRNTDITYYIHAKYAGAGTNSVSLYYRII